MTDVESIQEIELNSFQDPWDPELVAEVVGHNPRTCFVAEEDGRVVGVIAGGIEETGEAVYGHILNLAVQGEYRRRGIGTALVRRIEQEFLLMGAEGVQLEVRVSNTAARSFYRNLGYSDVVCLADYYHDGEDALLMMRWFRY
ncbi:MAG: ribosomal protein S18-alanine N-acetyltransferase [Methanoculleaceae archaeon]